MILRAILILISAWTPEWTEMVGWMLVLWQKLLFSVAGVKKLFGLDSFTGLGMSTIVDLYIFQANPSFLGPWVRKSKELLPWAKPIAVQPYSRSGSRDLSAHLWFRGSIAGYGWRVSSPIVTQPHSMVPTGFISYEKQWLLGGKDFLGDGTQQFSLFGSFHDWCMESHWFGWANWAIKMLL